MAAEKYGKPIREAVGALQSSLEDRKGRGELRESLLAPGRWQVAPDMVRPAAQMAAREIVAIWVVAVLL